MNDQKLDQYKAEWKNVNLLKPSSSASSEEYWHEISNGFYKFDKRKIELGYLHSIKKEDLIAFFEVDTKLSSEQTVISFGEILTVLFLFYIRSTYINYHKVEPK